ncbi:MAG: aconitase X swivel domain-containing protein [Candidatus Asgardarchaeia archaeon]
MYYGKGNNFGVAVGKPIVSKEPISFLAGVDPKTGTVVEEEHELFGKRISGKILFFPHGKGSTVGSYVMYSLKKNGCAPKAIVNVVADPVVVVGAVIAEIPSVFNVKFEYDRVSKSKKCVVDSNSGIVKLIF